MLYVGRQHLATDKSFCTHRFAHSIRVFELFVKFDEMHPSINDAGSRQSFNVPSFSWCQCVVLAGDTAPRKSQSVHRCALLSVTQILYMSLSRLGESVKHMYIVCKAVPRLS